MAVVISGANFNQEEKAQAASINYKNNTNAAGNADKTGTVKTFASAVVSTGQGKTQDATYKSLLQEADNVKEQIMSSAAEAKTSLKALFQKLSGAEVVRIDEDGFNLTSASAEDCVNIVEKIQIELAMHCDDYVPAGTAVDQDKIQQVTGSAGAANIVASKMQGIAVTEDHKTQIDEAMDMASKVTPMSEDVKNYMVANHTAPTIEGIYQAEHAVNAQSSGMSSNRDTSNTSKQYDDSSDQTFESLKDQISTIIQQAGLSVDEQNMNNAKAFLQNDIPVTKENLQYKAQLDQLDLSNMDSEAKQSQVLDQILSNIAIGESAGSTPLTDEPSVLSQVADAIDILNKSDINTVERATAQAATNVESYTQDTFTIQALKDAIHQNETEHITPAQNPLELSESDQSLTNQKQATQIQVTSNYAVLQEVRILMTAEAGVFLAKQGTNLFTTSIYDLAQQLRDYELSDDLYDEDMIDMNIAESMIPEQDNTADHRQSVYAQVFAVRQAVYEITQAPEDVIGKVLAETLAGNDHNARVTIGAFAQSGSSLRQQYDRAEQTYEAVGTQVRGDLGDSITKAVKNSTDTILDELKLENTEKNRSAVRILAANSMEITEDSINQVKQLHETLNHLVDNMKPETVLQMIRDHVNPMTDDISDVNEYLMQMNAQATEDNSEKYSRFLYKLDHTEGITQEERKQFIGIYKMMNIFTKDAGNSIGALVKQGADITMENLMTAYESRKSYGMDVTLDEETGMAEGTGTVQYYESLFVNTGNHVTPHTLKSAQEQRDIPQYTVDEFCEVLDENYDADIEAESLKGYIEDLQKSVELNTEAIRQIEHAGETVSINNLQVAEQLLATGTYPKIRGKNISDAIEKIGHPEELAEMYEELSEESDSALKEVLASTDNQTYENIEEARMSNHEIGYIKNLAVRHDYYIPIQYGTEETGEQQETGMIHLTLIQDSEEQGRISVEMEQKDIGKISMEAKVQGKRTDIFVMKNHESSDAMNSEELQNRLDQMKVVIGQMYDMDAVNIYQSETDKMPVRYYENAAEKTATTQLYGMAQVMVKVLAGRDS
ncbi:MAG: DUF6240 domain-containing protein [Lachnospira sp.]|nr:DUF6240 domain-containing protein [Lachnospira sp.]